MQDNNPTYGVLASLVVNAKVVKINKAILVEEKQNFSVVDRVF
jgi:hypothetical protein